MVDRIRNINDIINDSSSLNYSKNFKRRKVKKKQSNDSCDSYYLPNKIYFDTAMKFEDKDIRNQFFPLIKEIFTNPTNNDAILDIGGNLGDVTYMMNNYFPKMNIYTAEPVPNYYKHLVKRFKDSENVHIYNLAVGNRTIDKIIKYDQWHYMMIVNRRLYEKDIAHFMKLDNFYDKFVNNKNVLFLKIDVEGYEDEVLYSGENILKHGKAKLIYYEYHRSKTIWCKTKNSDLIHYLEEYGFTCYGLGKYKIVKLNEKCLDEYDKHIYPHTIAIKENSGIEDILVQSYNNKYYKH